MYITDFGISRLGILGGCIVVALISLWSTPVLAQGCFTDDWIGPPGSPPQSNRTKPVYQACNTTQAIDSNLDITTANSSEVGVEITHAETSDYPGLQVTLTSGTLAAVFGDEASLVANSSSGATVRIIDLSQNPELQLQYGSNSSDHWAMYVNADNELRFWANGDDRFEVTQTGQVIIPGGSPGADKVLVATDSTGLAEWRDASAVGGSSYWTLNGSDLYPNSTGYLVGIGLTDPSQPLEVKAASDNNIRLVEDGGSGTEYYDIGVDNSGDLNIMNDAGTVAISALDSNANVGIKTASPETDFHVNGDVRIDGAIRIDDGTALPGYVLTATNATGDAEWQAVSGGAGGSGYWDVSGDSLYPSDYDYNVVIGRNISGEDPDQLSTDGTVRLHVYRDDDTGADELVLLDEDVNLYMRNKDDIDFMIQNDNDRLYFYACDDIGDCNTEIMALRDNGRIGMGENDPGYKLELPNDSDPKIGRIRANAFVQYSDGRFKVARRPIFNAIDAILKLEPISYQWVDTTTDARGYLRPTNTVQPGRQYGLIAQDVYTVLPEVVYRPDDERTQEWSLDYGALVPVLIQAVKEQQVTIETLEQRIEKLEQAINY